MAAAIESMLCAPRSPCHVQSQYSLSDKCYCRNFIFLRVTENSEYLGKTVNLVGSSLGSGSQAVGHDPSGDDIADIYIMSYNSSKITNMKEQQKNFMVGRSLQHEELF